MKSRALSLAILAAMVAAAPAGAAPDYCDNTCSSSTCCTTACRDPLTGSTITCGDYFVCNFADYDCDGVNATSDNCPFHYNPGQQNCDGDANGDACDSQSSNYQAVPNSEVICFLWGFSHYDEYGVPVSSEVNGQKETTIHDYSSCGNPDYTVASGTEHDDCSWEPWAYDCCVDHYGATTCFWLFGQDLCSF